MAEQAFLMAESDHYWLQRVSPILGSPYIEHDNRGFANRGNTLKIRGNPKLDDQVRTKLLKD